MTIKVNQPTRPPRRITTNNGLLTAAAPQAKVDTPAASDQVSLGQSQETVEAPTSAAPAAAEVEKDDKGPLKLTLGDLSRPLREGKTKTVLASLDPKMTLSKLAEALFEADPAADRDSTFELHSYESDNWSNVTLSAKRELSNGTVISRIGIGRGPSDTEPAKSRYSLSYAPEKMPTGNQLPDVLQKHWGQVFEKAPTSIEEDLKEKYGDIGEASDINIYLTDTNKEKPYVNLTWQAKSQKDVKSKIDFAGEDSIRLSHSLTQEQMSSSDFVLPAVREAWENAGVDPEKMVEGMFKGAIAKPKTVELGMVSSESGPQATIAVDMVGRRGKLKGEAAGRVSFSFYDRTDDKGKSTKYAYHSLLNFREQFQGRGLAKSILANNFAIYEQQGIDKVDLYAAITVGGYAWAKYGWQLKPKEVEEGKLDKQIRARMETLELPPKTKKTVEAILESKSPKKNWALADLKQKVTKDGKETTLAKALLLGTRWAGTFDMHDKASRKRLERYLGK